LPNSLKVEKEVLETAERIVATSPQERVCARLFLPTAISTLFLVALIFIGLGDSAATSAAAVRIDPESKVIFYVGGLTSASIETLVRAVGCSCVVIPM